MEKKKRTQMTVAKKKPPRAFNLDERADENPYGAVAKKKTKK